jgi:branched-chain amino acid transport system ATP-binding protein
MSAAAVELRGIAAGYGGAVVLRDINLVVPAASAIALLGPNGAGKTTLLRTISGSIRPTSGAVLRDGENVTGLSVEKRAQRGLCHIPEGRGVFPSLTVKENLSLFAPRRQRKRALELATAAFPVLGQRLAQRAATLSGGEQQMLAMVRAYLSDPSLVLVDEASMGLAPLLVDQVFDFLRSLTAAGTSLLVVEQYVRRALDLVDSAYLLNRGRIVLEGTPQELEDSDLFEHYLDIETGRSP